MLALPHTNSWGFVYTNQDVGATAPGTSVIPGTTNAEGDWTEIAGDANITADIQYVTLLVHGGQTSGQAKNHLLDFGWDPAGGTSYVAFFSDWVCGASLGTSGVGILGGKPIHFPCKIPAGSAIAVRVQGSNGTAGTVSVLGHFYGKPSRPELWRPAAYTETLGTITNSNGVSFTPGNAGWGSWVSLGTTAKKHFWVQPGVQIDNTTVTLKLTHIQVAIGDGSNQHIICDFWYSGQTTENQVQSFVSPCQWEIPAGAELWIRGNCSAAPDTGFNATAVLFGG